MRRLLLLCATLLVLAWPSFARAHVRSVSWSTWAVAPAAAGPSAGAEVDVRVRLSRLDLSAVPGLDARTLDAYLREHLRLPRECVVGPSTPSSAAQADEPGFVVRTFHARCPEGVALRVTSDLFVEQIPSHLHFVSVSRGGATIADHMLSRDRPEWTLPREREGARFSELLSLGVRHILSGADHLVFLLMLVVAATSFRALVTIVTGFTVGHSAALALAVLSGVRPDAAAVEALVGATIAIVAVENVWLARRDPWLKRALLGALGLAFAASLLSRAIAPSIALGMLIFVASYFGLVARAPRRTAIRGSVTALFGLVHGFAFSSVLAELSLPRARLAGALFGFNLGVELGQLAIVALAWPLWRALSRTRAREHAFELASATALAAGVFWFVTRGFAG
ncbi:MAG: HupE/UreJ family protein [Deltaproteobacteria bacterium]|nr:HupE/UreJ family protein [Deltaproteobacteria bacterium]